ncbi:MAG: ATP-dependent DNA helicase RecG [Planctomycetes bacterium]|nr:ATP-dependent DNA helicase RecG [Planctomycetota bacterium]
MNEPAPATATSNRLMTPLARVNGIDALRADLLARIGLTRVRDLLFHFPRAYERVPEPQRVGALQARVPATLVGVIEEVELRELGGNRSILGVLLRCEDDYVRLVWFNQPFLRARYRFGQRVVAAGVPRMAGGRWEIAHPTVTEWPEGSAPPAAGLLPIYPLTEGLSQPVMRRIAQRVVAGYASSVIEVFPDAFREKHGLLGVGEAIRHIHDPVRDEVLESARHRFIYQELLVLQLALAIRRHQWTLDRRAPPLAATPKIRARIERLFPFEWTADQRKAIDEVAEDMARPYPMNRLLQGDVGTGKTVVAIFAMLVAVANGHQAALMAPTEVLARQHARTLAKKLEHGRVRIALLTGGQPRSERVRVCDAIRRGEIDIVVGTHALAHAAVAAQAQEPDATDPSAESILERETANAFSKLGLVVIDEQHKFGVAQRAVLKQAGLDPHYLVMTATPIPRTVSMTLFGDLDVSSLREAPPGRQPVHTYWGSDASRGKWWAFCGRKLEEGRQAYVILPLVDDASGMDAGATQAYETLANGPFRDFAVGLVHGRMSSDEKDEAMRRFGEGETRVLVATSVVEVGIDVPNATLMTIEGADRFGLAQLHQLRGRISRGIFPGFLCLFAQEPTDDARSRLDAFIATRDGFALAELDLKLRGPGDLFGTRQHGLPPLRVADLIRDAAMVEQARADARALIAENPKLDGPSWHALQTMVLARYGKALELGHVG